MPFLCIFFLNWRSTSLLLVCFYMARRTYRNKDCCANQKSCSEILFKGQLVPSYLMLPLDMFLLFIAWLSVLWTAIPHLFEILFLSLLVSCYLIAVPVKDKTKKKNELLKQLLQCDNTSKDVLLFLNLKPMLFLASGALPNDNCTFFGR